MPQTTISKDNTMSANALFDGLDPAIASDPAKLQAIMAAPDDKVQELVDKWSAKKEEPVAVPPVTPPEVATEVKEVVVPAVAPIVDEYKYIMTLPNNMTLRFKDENELKKHVENQQKVIDKLNGERGTIGTLKSRSEQLEAQVKQLQDQLQTVRVAPLQATAPATQAEPQPAPQANEILLQIEKMLNEKVMPLQSKLDRYEQMTNEEKQTSIFHAQFQSTANEVKSLTSEYPQLATALPFEKINEIVTQRPDQVEGLVSPSDLAKFYQTMEILNIYYDHTADGHVDISKKRLQDISEAATLWRKRNGTDALTSATVHNNSAQSVLTAVERAANRSPSLPPTAPAQPSGEVVMTVDEAKRHIDAANKSPISYKNDPLLSKKLQQAIMFANTLH